MADKPNVILITTDQQRYDSVGMSGSSFVKTPNMDRLGREGAFFRRAYCPNTVCSPSRASIMTGLHLSRHGAYNIGTAALDPSRFLSHELRRAGYRTYHVGKAHWYPWGTVNPETAPIGEDGAALRDFVGFDAAEVSIGHAGPGGITGHYAYWMRSKGYDPAAFQAHKRFDKDDNGTSDYELPVSLHSGTWIAERAVHYLEKHDRSQPFYLNLGFPDPHHPHMVPMDFKDRVDPEAIPYPDIPEPDAEEDPRLPEHIPHFRKGTINDSRFRGRFGMAGNQNTAWADYFRDREKGMGTRAYYYTLVQLIDMQLGILLDALDRLKLAEDTIVIFTSDHGEMLGDHGIGQKGPLVYEGVTRVPLLVRYPNSFRGRTVEDCVSLVDLLPTVLDYAGIPDILRRDGISLKPLLEEERKLRRPGVRIEYKEEPDRIRYKAWVTPEWKLAVYLGESFGELYDLKNDPEEKTNRFGDPNYGAVQLRLMTELLNDLERSEPVSGRESRV